MGTFLIIVMAALAGWAVLATSLAVAWGRNLRREREDHAQAQELIVRYRAAAQRLEKKAAATAASFEVLQREYLQLKQALEDREQAPVERPIPMLVIDSLDISGEVGTLFEHVSRVALAIRSYSAYTRGHYGQEPNKARYDLLWLADCLHTFDRIGKALATGSQRSLAAACEELLSMYGMYLKDGSGYDSRDTFRRLADKVPLDRVTEAARAIAMKTAQPPVAALTRGADDAQAPASMAVAAVG